MSDATTPSGMSAIEIDGVRLAYRCDGPDDAPLLVLVNSLGMDHRMWEPQMANITARYRVLRYDSRGHGESDAPAGPYTLERLALDLIALLDAENIQRPDFCGISLGGMVIQWIAINRPERVGRIALANSSARIGTVESWNERIAAVESGGMAAIRDWVMGRFLSERFRQAHPEEAQRITDILMATPAHGYIAVCEALREADLRDAVARITAPTLVIGSDGDLSTPPEQARDLHDAIAGSELVVLDDASHLSNVEQPEAFTQRLLAFLQTS